MQEGRKDYLSGGPGVRSDRVACGGPLLGLGHCIGVASGGGDQ